jgi:hypothetical protein
MSAFFIYGIVQTVTNPALGQGIAGFFINLAHLVGLA